MELLYTKYIIIVLRELSLNSTEEGTRNDNMPESLQTYQRPSKQIARLLLESSQYKKKLDNYT